MVPAGLNTDVAPSVRDRGSPIASNRPARHTRRGILRARHEPDISHGFRTFVPSNAPQSGNFGNSHRGRRIDRCGAHAMVSCAWKSPSKKISPEISPSPKISPRISPPGAFKKSGNFKGLRKISPISPISPGCRGYFLMRLHIYIRKR